MHHRPVDSTELLFKLLLCNLTGVWSKWRQTKTATHQNGDTKTATDCPDQNGDKRKRRHEQCVEQSLGGQCRPIFLYVKSEYIPKHPQE